MRLAMAPPTRHRQHSGAPVRWDLAPHLSIFLDGTAVPVWLLILPQAIQFSAAYGPLRLLEDRRSTAFFWHIHMFNAMDFCLAYILQSTSIPWVVACVLKILLCVALIVSSVAALSRLMGHRRTYITGQFRSRYFLERPTLRLWHGYIKAVITRR